MTDTIKLKLKQGELGVHWDVDELKSRLQQHDYPYTGLKPLGYLKNMRIIASNKNLEVNGSIARYYNNTNALNFGWGLVQPAIEQLSYELGLPIENARISRLDIAANIEVENDINDYLVELFHLNHYTRIKKFDSSLRFENNSHSFNYCFYDKIKEMKKKKLIVDPYDFYIISKGAKMMRVELQIQERLKLFLKMEEVRAYNLFSPDFCKLLAKEWFNLYMDIEKMAIPVIPKTMKGNRDIDKFIRRDYIQMKGWERFNHMLKKAVDQKTISASDKSKKLKPYKMAMQDNSSFIFQEYILELTQKIKVTHVESLKQIYLLNKNRTEKAFK